jgi:hypothetical protein
MYVVVRKELCRIESNTQTSQALGTFAARGSAIISGKKTQRRMDGTVELLIEKGEEGRPTGEVKIFFSRV